MATGLIEEFYAQIKPQPVKRQENYLPDNARIQISIKVNEKEIKIC